MSVSEILNLPNAEQQKEMVQVLQAISNGVSDIAGKKRSFTEIREWRTVQALVRLGLAPYYFKERKSDATGAVVQNGTMFACSGGTRWGQIVLEVIGIDREIVTDESGTPIQTVNAAGNTIPAHSITLAFRDSLGKYQFNRSTEFNWAASDLRCWLNSNDGRGIPTHQKFTYTGDAAFTVTANPETIVKVEVNGVIIPQYSGWTYENGTLNLIATPSANGATVVAFYYQNNSTYDNQNPGLLAENGLDAELQDVLAYRKSRTSGQDIIDKVFLLSETEVGSLGTDTLLNDDDYGSCYPAFYSSNKEASAANANRIKTDANNTAIVWWLRSNYGNYNVRCINASGSVGYTESYNNRGVIPCCVIA